MPGRVRPGSDPHLLASLRGWFSKNILLKVIALVLGLFLWFHAVTDQAHQLDYPVPLEIVVSDTTLVIVNEPPSEVSIIFAGTGKELLKLWWKKPFFVKEVEGSDVGVRDLSLDVSSLSMPSDINLIPLGVKSPAELHLALDRLIERELTIVSRLRIVPDEGYVLAGGVSIDPPTVLLSGARGELSNVDSIMTVEGVVDGVKDSFDISLPLDLSGMRTVAPSVKKVTLSGKVEKFVEIELGEIPITIRGRLRDEFSVLPGNIELAVIGPISLIQVLNKNEIDVYIEINDPPVGETYYSPMIELPDGIELLSEQPKLFKAVPAEDANGLPPEDPTRPPDHDPDVL